VIQCNARNLVREFFADRLGLKPTDDMRGVLHVPDDQRDELARMDSVAVAVAYNAFIGRTCCMHTVIQRPDLMTRAIVRDAFHFPFNVCGCEAVLGLVDSTNEAALSFDKKLGFVEVARIPNGGLEGDLVVLQMTRAACRWLPKPH
jgi:hypothetical protein